MKKLVSQVLLSYSTYTKWFYKTVVFTACYNYGGKNDISFDYYTINVTPWCLGLKKNPIDKLNKLTALRSKVAHSDHKMLLNCHKTSHAVIASDRFFHFSGFGVPFTLPVFSCSLMAPICLSRVMSCFVCTGTWKERCVVWWRHLWNTSMINSHNTLHSRSWYGSYCLTPLVLGICFITHELLHYKVSRLEFSIFLTYY